MKIETDLKRKIKDDLLRLRDMGSYRGRRHAMGLPARGQNTRSQVRKLEVVLSKSRTNVLVDHDCEKTQQGRQTVIRFSSCRTVYSTGIVALSAFKGIAGILGLGSTIIPTQITLHCFLSGTRESVRYTLGENFLRMGLVEYGLNLSLTSAPAQIIIMS